MPYKDYQSFKELSKPNRGVNAQKHLRHLSPLYYCEGTVDVASLRARHLEFEECP